MGSTSRRSSRLPAAPGRRSSAARAPSTPTRSTSTSPPRSTTRRSSATLTATSTADVARYTHEELMACVIAREVRDGETVAVGTLAAIPACGVLLAHFTHPPRATAIIINHPDYWPFRGGSKEFYDFAQLGTLGPFFLLGGQVDRHGNLHLPPVADHDSS